VRNDIHSNRQSTQRKMLRPNPGACLPAVTQLFTEGYMVEFLLHNTLGVWWAGKCGPIQAQTDEQARSAVALHAKEGMPDMAWNYLRFIQDDDGTWTPAAGTFDGWPKHAAEIRFLDPCMGSGHFLVSALPILARLRTEEEGFGAAEAVAAVLRHNLHGLEIDERCTQIAAFNVALTAWNLLGRLGEGGFESPQAAGAFTILVTLTNTPGKYSANPS
jgi:hypothetical protein